MIIQNLLLGVGVLMMLLGEAHAARKSRRLLRRQRLLARGQIVLRGPRFPHKLSAYHEAAHAVVARKLGCTVAHVDVLPETVRDGTCIHVTPDAYRVPGSRRIRGTPFRRETTRQEREAMALRQRDASIPRLRRPGGP